MLSTDQISSSIESANDGINACQKKQFDTLNFNWNGIDISAASEKSGFHGGMIRLSAKIGRLYFTVEDEYLRNEAIKILYASNRKNDGKFTLEKDGSVTFASKTTVQKQVAGNELIKAATVIMLEIGPQFKTLKSYLKTI